MKNNINATLNVPSKCLMIHSFSSNILPGDNSSIQIDGIITKDGIKPEFISYLKENNFTQITFDDGLYQQIPLVKMFIEANFETYIFPSGEFIREETEVPTIVDNALAHKEYHDTKTYPSTFMSSTEIWDLLNSGSNFGIHGWYHYNLGSDTIKDHTNSKDFKDILRALKKDAKLSVEYYFDNIIPRMDLTKEVIYINYCTPYNCQNEYQKIYIDFMEAYISKHPFSENYKTKLKVFSSERIPLEKLLETTQGAPDATK